MVFSCSKCFQHPAWFTVVDLTKEVFSLAPFMRSYDLIYSVAFSESTIVLKQTGMRSKRSVLGGPTTAIPIQRDFKMQKMTFFTIYIFRSFRECQKMSQAHVFVFKMLLEPEALFRIFLKIALCT